MAKKRKATKKKKRVVNPTLKDHTMGRSAKSLMADSKRKAKKPGNRKSKSGRKYFEDRPDRSDVKGHKI